MAQEVTVQEVPQEQQPQQPQEAPQQAASHEAANPLLEAFKILLERFKASQDGFEFAIQFNPRLFMTFEEFEGLVKDFGSISFVEFGKVTFAELTSVIAVRQSGSRCLRDQKRVMVAFRFGDDYGKTVLIDYAHGKRETVPGKC